MLRERPQAAAAARSLLAGALPNGAGHGDRVERRAGGFADVPPGGDVHLLSRVLHGGEDGRCREILRHLSAAMPPHADLPAVERLLPDDGSPSLATARDLHVRCTVGGRERTAGYYPRLFADAGPELVGREPLPLDARVRPERRARRTR
ncbi:methyltransferase [Kitasatospora fiedleri]|uniref:methyltransferase n=1 Tax=Kitasatospora fiedleri TaxID=2991545 RepID=UPI002499BAF1|nr:methyltransferase [Kitasatospora fiedleri]